MVRDFKRILILSDSLAAPRSKEGKSLLTYEESWPYLLRERFPNVDIIQISMGHATSEELVAQCPYWLPARPDIVFFQAGLNDILPRALHKHELEFAKTYPFFGKMIHRTVGSIDTRLRRWRNIVYLSEKRILASLRTLKSSFPNTYAIPVLVGSEDTVRRFAGVQARARGFNACAKTVFGENLILMEDIGEGQLQADGFHLNALGHDVVVRRIAPIVSAAVENNENA